MGLERATHSEVIAASPQACIDVVLDLDHHADWQSAVQSSRILERGGDGSLLVETEIDVKVRRVRYVLRYHAEPPGRVWWDYVEGDLRSVAGEYRFEDLGDGTTRATYELAVDPGRFVPGPLKKLLATATIGTVVRELKARVECR